MKIQSYQIVLVNILCFLAMSLVPSLTQTLEAQSLKTSSPGPRQSSNSDDDHIITNTDLISFNVTITDQYGRLVSGLPKSAFSVYDGKQPHSNGVIARLAQRDVSGATLN